MACLFPLYFVPLVSLKRGEGDGPLESKFVFLQCASHTETHYIGTLVLLSQVDFAAWLGFSRFHRTFQILYIPLECL
jgi:hypothetical protein